jgi:hypothetical protein
MGDDVGSVMDLVGAPGARDRELARRACFSAIALVTLDTGARRPLVALRAALTISANRARRSNNSFARKTFLAPLASRAGRPLNGFARFPLGTDNRFTGIAFFSLWPDNAFAW